MFVAAGAMMEEAMGHMKAIKVIWRVWRYLAERGQFRGFSGSESEKETLVGCSS